MEKTVRYIGMSVSLSAVASSHYDGDWTGTLSGPANDAKLFESLLGRASEPNAAYTLWQYSATNATRGAVINALDFAAKRFASGSILVFYVAAHGGQVPNLINADGEALDTLCLYDGMLLDVELNELWTRFDPGVRVVMLADTCSSGSVAFFEKPALRRLERSARRALAGVTRQPTTRGLAPDVAERTFESHRQQYEQWQVEAADRWASSTGLQADVLQLGACADGAEAFKRGGVGTFTGALFDTFGDAFGGSYHDLLIQLSSRCSPQEPTYQSSSATNDDLFARQRAFSPT